VANHITGSLVFPWAMLEILMQLSLALMAMVYTEVGLKQLKLKLYYNNIDQLNQQQSNGHQFSAI
jgi:hypothetical protein